MFRLPGLLFLAAALLGPLSPARVASREPAVGVEEAIGEMGREREEAIREGQGRYRAMSAPAVKALTAQWGGEWWVVHFREENRPDWIRGIIEGEYLLEDEGTALDRADVLKAGLRDILICCGKTFGAPILSRDLWTWMVEYPQVVGNVPVERASLILGLFREYRAEDRVKGQWNLEITDLTLDLPADLDPRPGLAPDGALQSLRGLGVPEDDLAGELGLVFARGAPGEPVTLCWRLEGKDKIYRIDASSGRLFGVIDKIKPLR